MAHRPPNFIFILADDLGYADLGCYGAAGAVSPVLDQMAADGLRFTDGYANSALCSPSRFALMTGRYQYRLRGAAEEPLPPTARGHATLGLPPDHPTLPSVLKAAGYATALVGKWHLGYPPHFSPQQSGYDEFFGMLGGGVDYFRHEDPAGVHDLHDGTQECFHSGYLTDILTERAVDCIHRQRAGQPFLLSLHYTAPHWPWEDRSDEAESRRIGKQLLHLDGGSLATYQRMIRHMDEGIGRVLDALQARGLADDTVVVFTSDNGGERFSNNWPLVGMKMDLLEGGIRVPLIVRWPRAVPRGGVTAQVALTMDWMPTFLAAAGVAPPASHAPDGIDLMPVLRDARHVQDREVFWRMNLRSQKAARIGHWKYLSMDSVDYLFDLSVDQRERANLARRDPQRLLAMRQRFDDWQASMPPIPADAYIGRTLTAAGMARPV